jgi:hypothetical protein
LLWGLLFQSTITGSYHTLPGVADWKTGVGIAGGSRVELNIAHHEVESAPEIVDRIADSEKHPVWGDVIRADLENAISGPRIVLDQDTVRASLGELPRLQVKVVDVLVGPFDL